MHSIEQWEDGRWRCLDVIHTRCKPMFKERFIAKNVFNGVTTVRIGITHLWEDDRWRCADIDSKESQASSESPLLHKNTLSRLIAVRVGSSRTCMWGA
jgi:hypothetical protein